jgi:pimeloyl-ACP methyl ester carboxylesterase
MLFLDQRGTGLSTAVTAATLVKRGNPQEQADYLRNFRADSIVKDCEAIRQCVTADYPEEKRKWSILGQSFGGFCAVNYLSKFPEGLREVFLCGGLPPMVDGPDPVYEQTFSMSPLILSSVVLIADTMQGRLHNEMMPTLPNFQKTSLELQICVSALLI